MKYKYTIEQDGAHWLATFPDIPEAITGAETLEETIELAEDVLLSSFDFYFEDNRPIPMPSPVADGDRFVIVPPSVVAKVLLLNTMLEQNVSQAELARRMNTRPQEVQRFIDLGHTTKIDRLEAALSVMGRHLDIRLA
ncbi:type II toxin-antitoxin system HicB family antitoxin [Aeromonas salmonicida]|uniref:type II toxin-antitoxin system HicB family antitoxin n=1 Tax=Aeromonas salmonicida TaxID=645 RepID=UPI00111B766B|nr:type II toxin-antitoxin system HicB family antitoxin [Aeromonas salmonicida]TNI89486.1 antitoxin [Aeromonas salmonicida]